MPELQYYRERLQRSLDALKKNPIQSVQNTDGQIDIIEPHANNSDEEISAADVEVDLALEELALKNIMSIEAALTRIGNGDFGICIDCGNEIPPARLDAFPAAARCLNCKQRFEESEN